MFGDSGGCAANSAGVNADSMATWFSAVLAGLDGVRFDIRIEDQDHSARLLREGVVMGVVTTPAYLRRYLPDGFTAAAAGRAPPLAWNRDDALQDMLIRKVFRRDVATPQHYVPTAEDFGAAVRAGLGCAHAVYLPAV